MWRGTKTNKEQKLRKEKRPTPGEIVTRSSRKNWRPSGPFQHLHRPRSTAPKDLPTGEKRSGICIPWNTLDVALHRGFPFPIPYRGTRGLPTRPTTSCSLQQPVNSSYGFGKLQTPATPKPLEPQRRPSDTSLPHLNHTSNPKHSLRFAANRAVDAHFRFRRKSAPTPNEGEPPLLLGTGGSPGPSLRPPTVSSRLTCSSSVSAPPNMAVDAFC